MRFNRTLVPVGTLVMVLGVGGLSAYAGQRDNRGRDRNGRESEGQARQRDGGQDRGGRYEAPVVPQQRRDSAPSGRYENRDQRGGAVPERRGDDRPNYGGNGRPNYDRDPNGRRDTFRYEAPRDNGYRAYGAPRILPGRQAPRHYYGPGGGFSAYFGWGSGYLFGSTYAGRVYGYSAPRVYSSRVYYGDVRLQVRPRDAAVYVDGYYAGVVDDFDGVFQRLTLEVGPHQIELDAQGLEPQFFDIYVDPARTVDIRSDLFR